MPEVLWKNYIDLEISEKEDDKVTALSLSLSLSRARSLSLLNTLSTAL